MVQSVATKTCSNCGTPVESSFAHCPRCAQSTHLHRFTLGHLAHDVFHAVTHADKSILKLARDLAIRPGVVAYEYIIQGKRKKYFNPFTFLLLVLGFTLLMYSTFHPITKTLSMKPSQEQSRMLGTPEKRQAYEAAMQRNKEVLAFSERQAKLVTVTAIPILAFVFWLCFRKRGLNYAEHLVFNVLLMSIISLLGSLAIPIFEVLNISMLSTPSMILLYGSMIGYPALGYYQFFRFYKPISIAGAVGVSLLAVFVYNLTTMLATIGYMAWGAVQLLK